MKYFIHLVWQRTSYNKFNLSVLHADTFKNVLSRFIMVVII